MSGVSYWIAAGIFVLLLVEAVVLVLAIRAERRARIELINTVIAAMPPGQFASEAEWLAHEGAKR